MSGPTFDIISTYTRAQALEDGVLVDVTQLAREFGFKYPVALTRAVHEQYVKLTPAAKRACNDETGRLCDILGMASWAVKLGRFAHGARELHFKVRVVTKSIRPSLVSLKLTIGPGDTAEPVLTILLPEED